jgi:polyisoprenoid-binding protein YceI
MRGRLLTILLPLITAFLFAQAGAETARWEIVPGDGTQVEFISKAPLESFTGRTKQVTGWVTFDPDQLAGTVTLEVAVDMASFDTGLKKRNQHMRENHLHTDRFPQSWLRGGTLEKVSASNLPVGGTVSFGFLGELELHGVRRPVACTITLSRPTVDTLAVTSEFRVKLSDHEIERPKMLVMKLADEQRVRVSLAMRRAS